MREVRKNEGSQMPNVSVVIPTYNCGQYIRQAIESALSQTYKGREIIVVDDGSSDNTYEIIKPYEESGSLRYIYQENRGLPGARNTGIQNAQGEFVVVLDADDELDERMISLCLEQVEKENTDWCVCDIIRVETYREDLRKEVYRAKLPQNNYKLAILADDFISRSAFFRKTSLYDIGLYHEDVQVRVDWEINIRLILAGKQFSYMPEPLYIYKLRSSSLVKTHAKKKFDYTLQLLKKHHKKLADMGDREIAQIYAQNLWRLARAYMAESRAFGAGIGCIVESMRYDFSMKRLIHPFYHHLIKRWANQDSATRELADR
ncbi:putative Glycosyl transferase, family 2 [Candidatus Sulfobium mesophilum]|uniref:Putative Glycosyl transferase, family 2 n=1 Tax=Candidatus Sulfobium mesophilum TaxID=2016548 RepID=A0A2U3QDN0_9BACT|nr:putative Glycosyl transferase, family 2 [Candidatus Sulfobium mesophilum]